LHLLLLLLWLGLGLLWLWLLLLLLDLTERVRRLRAESLLRLLLLLAWETDVLHRCLIASLLHPRLLGVLLYTNLLGVLLELLVLLNHRLLILFDGFEEIDQVWGRAFGFRLGRRCRRLLWRGEALASRCLRCCGLGVSKGSARSVRAFTSSLLSLPLGKVLAAIYFEIFVVKIFF
jgi:hypothetical protein